MTVKKTPPPTSVGALVKAVAGLAVLVAFAVALVSSLTSGAHDVRDGLTGDDKAFADRLMGHYGQDVDDTAWPAAISAARGTCTRLTDLAKPWPWADNLLVVEQAGAGKPELAEAVARAGVDTYCPAAGPLVPPAVPAG